jgi:hypothetical protein
MYASFGTPTLSPEVEAFEQVCYQAGRVWAATHKKLPVHTDVMGRDVPVVGSRHEWAKAFVRGFKAARK